MQPQSSVADVPRWIRLRNTVRALGVLADDGDWIDPSRSVLICAYPRRDRALARLRRLGIRRLVNLHRRSHAPGSLVRYGLTETHVPVPDFGAPTLLQLATTLGVIHAAVQAGERIAVHCSGGLGRSGTVAACYLIDLGQDWRIAVDQVRRVRPGAIETQVQLASIATYAK